MGEYGGFLPGRERKHRALPEVLSGLHNGLKFLRMGKADLTSRRTETTSLGG